MGSGECKVITKERDVFMIEQNTVKYSSKKSYLTLTTNKSFSQIPLQSTIQELKLQREAMPFNLAELNSKYFQIIITPAKKL